MSGIIQTVYKMAIHVKDQKTDALVRKLAEMRGVGITEAIREAVEETLAAEKAAAKQPVEALRRRLQPLFDEIDAYPPNDVVIDKSFFDKMWDEEER